MGEWNEHLPRFLTMPPNIVLHGRITAGKAFFLTEPFKDPLRRMALLLRTVLILQKPLVNCIGEGFQLRAPNFLAPAVTRGRRIRAHLVDRSTGKAKITGDRTFAAPLIEMRAAHG